MNPSRFARLDDLFFQAMQLSPDAREAFAAAACGNDDDLKRLLQGLLANAARSVDAFDDSPVETLPIDAPALEDETELLSGYLLGSQAADGGRRGYQIVRLIGRGGMGFVYLARQHNPERDVALKVIRPELATSRWIRRLKYEAQVLAILNHPGIAHFYEMGDSEGPPRRHFYVMEYVDGAPLTAYAASVRLDLKARLELMRRVCDALQHAHDRGVVHRDLKPGNILVDASGQPKILDFGIARLLNPSVHATSMHTAPGQIFGTLQYMSPEQASGETAAADVRSDVYALGVILFELLCGRFPHDIQAKQQWEAARIIREDEPTRLGSIDRSFRGDIETIVSKALERDPARRYPSVRDLEEDIRRYLHREPIRARRASTWYEVKKFANRNRTVVGLVAAIFVILVSGLIYSGVLLAYSSELLAQVKERNQHANNLLHTFSDVLSFADPSQNPENFSSKAWLQAHDRQLDERFSGDKEVQARIGLKIGRGFVGIGEYDRGVARMKKSYQAFMEAPGYGLNHPLTLDALVRIANAKNFAEDRPAAIEFAAQVLARTIDQASPWTDPIAIRSLSELSRSFSRFEEWRPDAVAFTLAAMRFAQASPDISQDDRLDVMVNAMRVLSACQRARGYDAVHERLLAELGRYHVTAVAPPPDPKTLDDWKPPEQNVPHPRMLAEVYEYACVLLEQGEAASEQAEPWLIAVMDSRRRRFGEDHFEFVITQLSMGLLCETQGRLREAEAYLTRYVRGTKKRWPNEPARLAQPLCSLLRLRMRLGITSLQDVQENLDFLHPLLTDLGEKRANWLVADALCRLRSGDPKSAADELNQALRILVESNGKDSLAARRTERILLEELNQAPARADPSLK